MGWAARAEPGADRRRPPACALAVP